jgi:hypothetical protein
MRLMSSEYVQPYVTAQKNDDRDAEAIAEAADPAIVSPSPGEGGLPEACARCRRTRRSDTAPKKIRHPHWSVILFTIHSGESRHLKAGAA